MDPKKRYSDEATCTTCQFEEDFSNYWTAVMYFKARNGTYKRIQQKPNIGFEGATGGSTVYYMQDSLVNSGRSPKVTAFKQVCPHCSIKIPKVTVGEGIPHVRGKSFRDHS
jgi:Domain of unknown function (DUF1996)